MFTSLSGVTLLLTSAPYLAIAAHHSSSSSASTTKLHNYLGHQLTHEQFQDKSILLKLEYEAKNNRKISSSFFSSSTGAGAGASAAHHSEETFVDILSEIQQMKHIHGQALSPHLHSLPLPPAGLHHHKGSHKKSSSSSFFEKFNETSSTSSHLRRSLMKKNNFLELSLFSDVNCENKVRSVGRLVNYCYNQYTQSFLFKVNKKENVIAQVEYEEQDCRGIPSKVSNLQLVTHGESEAMGDCNNGIQWNYLSYYPSFTEQGAAYGATYSFGETCDPSLRNYYGYDFRKADVCIKIPRQTSVYAQSNVQGCEGEGGGGGEGEAASGAITVNYFFDSTCSGSVANSLIHQKEICAYPSSWDGDDQDDFKQDGSNYVMGEVHTDYCYDPSHSTTPPPPVTGTCSSPYFYWVGDGFCDSSMNTPECNYDGGDCCSETCVDTQFDCGVIGYNCLDPNYAVPPPATAVLAAAAAAAAATNNNNKE